MGAIEPQFYLKGGLLLEYVYTALEALFVLVLIFLIWEILSYNRLWTLSFKIDQRSKTINEAVIDFGRQLIELLDKLYKVAPSTFEGFTTYDLAKKALDMAESAESSDEATDAGDAMSDAFDSLERALETIPAAMRADPKLRSDYQHLINYNYEINMNKIAFNSTVNAYNRRVFRKAHWITVKVFKFKMRSIYFLGDKDIKV